MNKKNIFYYLGVIGISLIYTACMGPHAVPRAENKTVPANFSNIQDTVNSAKVKWKDFFTDPNLVALIDTALQNNQELNIILQEINLAQYEVKARKGAYLPYIGVGVGADVEKTPRYTRDGAIDENSNNTIAPGKSIPQVLPTYMFGAIASWQVDIWKQLRNSKNAAARRFLATTEGKNFMVTHLVSEIANSYYELMALDNQLEILKRNIEIQQNALEMVKQEKKAAKTTELAVRRFQAEVLKNQSRQFYIKQQIIETENRINFLVGRYPKPVPRNSQTFADLVPTPIHAGIPSQLLENRTDIKQAEQSLAATKLDVKAAKANFYPTFMIMGGIGYEAFNPQYLITTPQSMLYNLAGGLVAPLINRNAIKAAYYSSNSRQIQAVYNYERTILKAYIEVVNQLSNINNLEQSYALKAEQVDALTQSIDISIGLFRYARADYMDVLLTQRDALESKFELIETKKKQMNAVVNVYQALGGGWK
jgi:NodT family efflux transporter outer membrane factor (OMF) lipoprotein